VYGAVASVGDDEQSGRRVHAHTFSQQQIHIINHHTIKHEATVQVNSDADSRIRELCSSGLGVWLALSASPLIKLYHALTLECLLEINVCPLVTKTLAGCDDIIRQHKLSCLRVTSLVCCKDLLWIGSSAGVILTVPLPHLTHNSARLTNTPPVTGNCYCSAPTCPCTVAPVGHAGLCRFVLAVDPAHGVSRSSSFSSGHMVDMARRRMSLNVAALQQGKVCTFAGVVCAHTHMQMYVIAGGDGFEDYQDIGGTGVAGDDAGADDSANHLLIWEM
jgi:hypothetical protein